MQGVKFRCEEHGIIFSMGYQVYRYLDKNNPGNLQPFYYCPACGKQMIIDGYTVKKYLLRKENDVFHHSG